DVVDALTGSAPSFISVFAGRIADTGLDPGPLMTEAVRILESEPRAELMWASPRELLNIFQADAIGCHIITVTQDILKKLSLVGKDLDEYSLETVKMFHDDGEAARFSLELAARRGGGEQGAEIRTSCAALERPSSTELNPRAKLAPLPTTGRRRAVHTSIGVRSVKRRACDISSRMVPRLSCGAPAVAC